jgi:hypothetical protein
MQSNGYFTPSYEIVVKEWLGGNLPYGFTEKSRQRLNTVYDAMLQDGTVELLTQDKMTDSQIARYGPTNKQVASLLPAAYGNNAVGITVGRFVRAGATCLLSSMSAIRDRGLIIQGHLCTFRRSVYTELIGAKDIPKEMNDNMLVLSKTAASACNGIIVRLELSARLLRKASYQPELDAAFPFDVDPVTKTGTPKCSSLEEGLPSDPAVAGAIVGIISTIHAFLDFCRPNSVSGDEEALAKKIRLYYIIFDDLFNNRQPNRDRLISKGLGIKFEDEDSDSVTYSSIAHQNYKEFWDFANVGLEPSAMENYGAKGRYISDLYSRYIAAKVDFGEKDGAQLALTAKPTSKAAAAPKVATAAMEQPEPRPVQHQQNGGRGNGGGGRNGNNVRPNGNGCIGCHGRGRIGRGNNVRGNRNNNVDGGNRGRIGCYGCNRNGLNRNRNNFRVGGFRGRRGRNIRPGRNGCNFCVGGLLNRRGNNVRPGRNNCVGRYQHRWSFE